MQQGKRPANMFFQKACIDFSTLINFLEVPDAVMKAARGGLTAAMQKTEKNAATLEECIAAWDDVQPEHVFCGSGASEVVRSLLQALKPKHILIPAPGGEEFQRAFSLAGCTVHYYYAKADEDFCISLDDFCKQITEDIDAVFLCNPNNPTAVLYDRTFVEAVLKQCQEAHALLVLDECLLDFVEDAGQYTMKSKEASESLFIVKDFTKMFALPGIRIGYGLCTDRLLLDKMRGAVSQNVLPGAGLSAVSIAAGTACTKEREFVQKTVTETAAERAWLLQELKRLGMAWMKGAANFIFFASRPRMHVFSILHGIMLRDCSSLEGLHEGYYRIAVRSRAENEKLIEVLRQWQEQA